VANMTLFTIALLGKHPESVSLLGMGHNLLWVTLGNLLSGSLFMALGYWLYSGARGNPGGEDTDIEEETCKTGGMEGC
ncbi:MAG: hypothetical protein QGG58_09155, partial [Chloroflexota bacterium]|nr:hypothetical protein [Chloroflexota bacterium]